MVAGLAVLAGLIMLFLRWKRKRDGEESHPMLTEQRGNMLLIPTPDEARALEEGGSTSGNSGEYEAKWRPSSNPADRRKSGFNWESPYDLAYTGQEPQTPKPTKKAKEMRERDRAELQGCDRQPVEMSTQALSPKWRVSDDDAAAAQQRYSGTEWGAADLAGETAALSQGRGGR